MALLFGAIHSRMVRDYCFPRGGLIGIFWFILCARDTLAFLSFLYLFLFFPPKHAQIKFLSSFFRTGEKYHIAIHVEKEMRKIRTGLEGIL